MGDDLVDDQLSQSCLNSDSGVPHFVERCYVEVEANVLLSCSWETDKCDKWEVVPKTCQYMEEQMGSCKVKLRDLVKDL